MQQQAMLPLWCSKRLGLVVVSISLLFLPFASATLRGGDGHGYSKAPKFLRVEAPVPRAHHDNKGKHPFKCFETNEELKDAVQKYDSFRHPNPQLALKYGWPIGHWCVDQLTDFSNVFANKQSFNEPLKNWHLSQATTMAGMFHNAAAFNQDLSHFNTTHVRDMSNLFEGATAFEGKGLEHWNTHTVTTMDFMFLHASSFDQDISHWDVQNVLSMKALLKDAKSFSQERHLDLLAHWDFNANVNMLHMSDYWDEGSKTFDEEGTEQPPPKLEMDGPPVVMPQPSRLRAS